MLLIVIILIFYLLFRLVLSSSSIALYISLFLLDKAALLCFSWYLIHKYFSVKFSSGKAIYFWDILLSLIIVGIYSIVFKLIYDSFEIVGKILNFVISIFSAYFTFSLIIYIFSPKYLKSGIPLLNNYIANQIVNYILIIILGIIIFIKREDSLL